jgi:hypothetical protein
LPHQLRQGSQRQCSLGPWLCPPQTAIDSTSWLPYINDDCCHHWMVQQSWWAAYQYKIRWIWEFWHYLHNKTHVVTNEIPRPSFRVLKVSATAFPHIH